MKFNVDERNYSVSGNPWVEVGQVYKGRDSGYVYAVVGVGSHFGVRFPGGAAVLLGSSGTSGHGRLYHIKLKDGRMDDIYEYQPKGTVEVNVSL